MITQPKLLRPLASSANHIIAAVLQTGCTVGPVRIPAPQGETDAVAAVLLGALPRIALTWSSHLAASRFAATFTGVFCHAAPQVAFTDTKGVTRPCELADLLVVVDDYGSIRKPLWRDRRANLVQAKLAYGPIAIGSGLPWRQLDLYTHWHPFRFTSPQYVQRQLDIGQAGTPPHPDDSGRYGGIHCSTGSWTQVVPHHAMTTTAGIPLGSFIAGMALGTPTSGRKADAGGADDWSTTIDELLRVTAGHTMSSSVRPWAHGQPKQVVSPLFDSGLVSLGRGSGMQIIIRDPPPGTAEPRPERSPENGVSVLHVSIVRLDDPEI
jgi:hypothetical protein